MSTQKKAIERRRAELKAAGGLRAWVDRERTARRLKAAFKPTRRAARVIVREQDQ